MAKAKDTKKKVLVIEGHSGLNQRLKSALESSDYKVRACLMGDEGMKAMYDELPHLILLDTILPDTDGYAILKQIQKEPFLKKIPVFLLSTQGKPIDISRIPTNSVKEYIIMMYSDIVQIVSKIDVFFGKTAR